MRGDNRVVHGTTAPALVTATRSGVRDAGGRALVVGGWVRDTLLTRPSPEPRSANPGKDIDMEVFGIAAEKLPALLATFGRVEAVGQSFPVYKVVGTDGVAIDVALPRRESKQRARPQGLRGARRSVHVARGSRAPSRLHDQRHLVGSADRRVRRSRGRPRAISSGACCAPSIPQTFGDDSLRALRAVQFAARFEFTLDADTADLCRRIRLDDLPAGTNLGRDGEAAPAGGATIDRLHARPRPRHRRSGAAEMTPAHRLRAGAGVASRRRRVDSHADGDRPRARAERRSRSSSPDHRDARRHLPRPGQALDHGVHRRPDPIARSRAGRRRSRRSACSID